MKSIISPSRLCPIQYSCPPTILTLLLARNPLISAGMYTREDIVVSSNQKTRSSARNKVWWGVCLKYYLETWSLVYIMYNIQVTIVGSYDASWLCHIGRHWCQKQVSRSWMSNYISQYAVGYYYIISYPLFADADTRIYPHAALQYHAGPKAKRGIAMLSVDKFPYPRKQTRGNEFILCSNNICDILKRFRSFKIPAITLIWAKSPYKHSVTRSNRSGKESGRRSESPLWRHQWRSFVFISHADDIKHEIRLHISRLLTNQKRESARSMG